MTKTIHQGRVIKVTVEEVELPNGGKTVLDVIRHPGASAILPLDGDDVILIRQWRHCAGGWLWEVPAGTLNAGEDLETCARRELVEEAGVEATEMIRAGFIFTAPGFCDEKIHLWIARGLRPARGHLDDDEVIAEVKRVPYDEALAMVASGDVVDAKSIACLLHGLRYRAPSSG